MKKYIFLLVLLSTTVYGEWIKTGAGDASSIYVDIDTKQRNGDLVTLMYLQNFPLGTITNDSRITYKSSKTIQEFNCRKAESRTISFEWFSDVMGGGKRVYMDAHVYPYEKVSLGSLIASVMKKACN